MQNLKLPKISHPTPKIPYNVTNPAVVPTIHIPISVQKKAAYICKHIPDNEWYGWTLYKYEGNRIDVLDIVPVGKTTGYFFEVEGMTSPIGAIIAGGYDLETTKVSLLHSHCVLNTSPSVTDFEELRDNAEKYDTGYLSVICNNKNEWSATFGIHNKVKETIKEKKYFKFLGFSRTRDVERVVEREVVDIIRCNVEVENWDRSAGLELIQSSINVIEDEDYPIDIQERIDNLVSRLKDYSLQPNPALISKVAEMIETHRVKEAAKSKLSNHSGYVGKYQSVKGYQGSLFSNKNLDKFNINMIQEVDYIDFFFDGQSVTDLNQTIQSMPFHPWNEVDYSPENFLDMIECDHNVELTHKEKEQVIETTIEIFDIFNTLFTTELVKSYKKWIEQDFQMQNGQVTQKNTL